MAHWFDSFAEALAVRRSRREALGLLAAGIGTSILGCSSSSKPASQVTTVTPRGAAQSPATVQPPASPSPSPTATPTPASTASPSPVPTASLTPSPSPTPSPTAAPTPSPSALIPLDQVQTVNAYYQAISDRQYAQAYALLSAAAQAGNPYDRFLGGYSLTLGFQFTATPTTVPNTVHIDLTAIDGTPAGGALKRQFSGVWHLVLAPSGTSWLLDTAAIDQVGPAVQVAPFSAAPTVPSQPPTVVPAQNGAPAQVCCRHCSAGTPCGNSCISARDTCHAGVGCAC